MDGPTPEPADAPEAPADGPKPPVWKNPFVIGFVIGIAVLTVLPFLQRRFLKAPPPISSLAPWALPTVDGGSVSSEALKGTVWLASFAPPECDATCREDQARFGRALNHVDDFDGGIALVTFAFESTAVPEVPDLRPGRWYVTRASAAQLDGALVSLREGFTTFGGRDGGATAAEFARVPGLALVDQRGDLRGFWLNDPAGRGNAINAARLLARYGPQP
jgi:hypothetical protein